MDHVSLGPEGIFGWTWIGPLIACPCAAAAAAIDLGLRWRLSPLTSARFGRAYFAILILDAIAAFTMLGAISVVPALHLFIWLWTPFGWAITGLITSLIVRGNLTEVGLGNAKVGIGFGFLYVPIRTPFDRILFDEAYLARHKRNEILRQHFLKQATLEEPINTFSKVLDAYEGYLHALDSNPQEMQSHGRVSDMARAYISICKQNSDSSARVIQLIDYIVDRGHLTALEAVYGRIREREIRVRFRAFRRS
jgi:hypothetical protein